MLKGEWFAGKDCLDIGSNTGQVRVKYWQWVSMIGVMWLQVTVSIAKNFSPKMIVGIDIDQKLVKMAWKNLHRCIYTYMHAYSFSLKICFNNYCVFYNSRDFFPALAPDGRPFPLSLTQSRDPVTFPLPLPAHGANEGSDDTNTQGQAKGTYPHNIKFIHVSMTS